jgi:Predicted nucleotide-binding protein containing TIR-like domain
VTAAPHRVRPSVLISSSPEGRPLAEALQENLQPDCRARIAAENAFKLSHTAIESLLEMLEDTDFAVVIVTPDDARQAEGYDSEAARENVLLEFALATGRLGRDRSFLVAPRDAPDLQLPTHMLGIGLARYYWSRGENDWLTELGPAASKIRRAISKTRRLRPTVRDWAYFSDFTSKFGEMIINARVITLHFIHSRRWRENNLDQLEQALQGECQLVEVFLPDVTKTLLRESVASHFDDGPFVAGLVLEGLDYWRRLAKKYPSKIHVRLFDLYPTYSFYRFDRTVVVAMYPNSARKKDVPAFQTDTNSSYWAFIEDDLDQIRHKPPLTIEQLEELVNRREPK